MKLVAFLSTLVLASPLRAQDGKEELVPPEQSAGALKERISSLEIALYPQPASMKHRLDDLNSLRAIAGLLLVSGVKLPMKDGALDVYKIYRKGHVSDDQKRFVVFRCERTGVAPTREEAKAGDYVHFPYERWRGIEPPAKGQEIPILWDRVAQADGTRLVAMSSGAAVVMEEAKLLSLLKAHGQLTLMYSQHGVSFDYPRRFRISEKKTPAGPLLFIDDPVTPDKDLIIGVHGKQMLFPDMYLGLKKGLKVKTTLEETEIKEPIDKEEVAGKKLVYLREGDDLQRVLRFFVIRKTHTVTVSTTLDDDGSGYPRLQRILHSLEIEAPEAKKPKKEVEEEFD